MKTGTTIDPVRVVNYVKRILHRQVPNKKQVNAIQGLLEDFGLESEYHDITEEMFITLSERDRYVKLEWRFKTNEIIVLSDVDLVNP